MKTKIILTALLGSLLINAKVESKETTVKGSLDVGYSSQSHRRGSLISQDALQGMIGLNTAVNGVDVFGDLYLTDALNTGNDRFEGTLGAGCKIDMFDLYAGVYNTSIDTAGSTLDVFLAASLDAQITPSIYIYRDMDDELYTYEGQLSYSFGVNDYDISLSGVIGQTDLTESDDSTYSAAIVKINRPLTKATDVYVGLAASDSDLRDVECITNIGLVVKF